MSSSPRVRINQGVSNLAYSRMMTYKRLLSFYSSQGNISCKNKRIIGLMCKLIDDQIGRELRLRFFSWLVGRNVTTSSIGAKGGLREREAFTLLMIFRPAKLGTMGKGWSFLNPDITRHDFAYIKQCFEVRDAQQDG
jgi:hypothetical protein